MNAVGRRRTERVITVEFKLRSAVLHGPVCVAQPAPWALGCSWQYDHCAQTFVVQRFDAFIPVIAVDAEAWAQMASKITATLAQPTHTELQVRRGEHP
jgi:hypothetical protein